ncbi:helix-turn-helix domain-containing protein [Apilactobacillus nanyangensis]|uniref:Helix-turn-helix domain-containing protein n=1 Tax=Apilactobacillus nanyangensis TaxID=2799579 RepID=A0ABT0HZ85_9LACO|nr:helix-turn-helix domain-containing protein [Apilactobacillus nanyangensis]MCK8612232.1 helix-turn-helix domain-containing protein [Apilactobacillus nanyangensis]
MNKTIREIADDLNISKQRVYRYIERNNIKEIKTDKNAKYYDDAAQKIIINHFGDASDNGSNSDAAAEANQLKEDIIKRQDDEINRLAKQVENLQRIIDTQAKQFDQQQQLELESIRTFQDNKLISSDTSKDAKNDATSVSRDAAAKDTKAEKGGLFKRFWHSGK